QSGGEKPANASRKDSSETMIVTGRVLDPEGNPVKNAAVDVKGWARSVRVGAAVDSENFLLLGGGETGGDGRFQLEAPRTSSDRFMNVVVLAAAKGYSLGWAYLDP